MLAESGRVQQIDKKIANIDPTPFCVSLGCIAAHLVSCGAG